MGELVAGGTSPLVAAQVIDAVTISCSKGEKEEKKGDALDDTRRDALLVDREDARLVRAYSLALFSGRHHQQGENGASSLLSAALESHVFYFKQPAGT